MRWRSSSPPARCATSASRRRPRRRSVGRTPYVHDDVLELSAWAHDALALELPDKILHSPDCAGLCPECGKDLNVEPHTHVEERGDPRWAALEQLRNGSSG